MRTEFINRVLRIAAFRGRMAEVVRFVAEHGFREVAKGLEERALGEATEAAIEALERILPNVENPFSRAMVREVLSSEFYQQANLHPQNPEEIEVLRGDGILQQRSREIKERLVQEKGLPEEAAEAFLQAMLKYPRVAFLADFHSLLQVYSSEPIVMTAGELIGGYDYQISVLAGANLQPGQRVLHLGTGTGWTDAVMAEIIIPEGRLTSVDIKIDLINTTKRRLNLFGLENVDLLCQEAMSYLCSSEEFSYDRVLFSFFIPPFFFDSSGMLDTHFLLPLKIGGILQFPSAIKDKIVTYRQLIRISAGEIRQSSVQTFEFDDAIG